VTRVPGALVLLLQGFVEGGVGQVKYRVAFPFSGCTVLLPEIALATVGAEHEMRARNASVK